MCPWEFVTYIPLLFLRYPSVVVFGVVTVLQGYCKGIVGTRNEPVIDS